MIESRGRLLAALAALFLVWGRGWAQSAPEGNAHPSMAVEPATAAPADPFGAVEAPPTGDLYDVVAKKIAFARKVDLSPLSILAVNEGGRVKIVGTLAREAIASVTGKRRYEEYLPGANEKDPPRKYAFDPIFTLFDVAIDPGFYVQRPVVHIDYLPLRRAIVEHGIAELRRGENGTLVPVLKTLDDEMMERYLRLTRVSPLMLSLALDDVRDKYDSSEPFRVALTRTGRAMNTLDAIPSCLRLIAPESQDAPWHFIGEDRPGFAAVNRLARELGSAWRTQDADRVNAIAKELAEELPKINASLYPTTRRTLESVYNRAHPFTWGYWGYFMALVALLLAFGTGRRWLVGTGIGLLAIAIGLHAMGFILRCIIAERFAIQNQFESMTGVSLFASVMATVIMAWRRQWLFGAAAAGTGFLVLITATEARIPGQSIGREAAILNTSVLLKYHVTTVLTSYGLIALGFVLSLFYLGVHYGGRLRRLALGSGDSASPEGKRRTLKDLDIATMIVLQLAFWTLGVGILLGAWWADHSWGRWWAFDPKETWALLTWIIYLILIHVRLVSKKRELATAWLSVLGFVTMLWTYFGVNLVLPGLHAYA